MFLCVLFTMSHVTWDLMVEVPLNWIDKIPNAAQNFLLYTEQVIAKESFGNCKAI